MPWLIGMLVSVVLLAHPADAQTAQPAQPAPTDPVIYGPRKHAPPERQSAAVRRGVFVGLLLDPVV